MPTQQRINLWSSPRNISTAIMYSFANRPDVRVVDEPLYAHYLTHQVTDATHPGKDEILMSQENNGARVVQEMLTADYGKSTVVFKQMTHHLIALNQSFLEQMDNVLLIRDPRAILTSFSKVVEKVTAEDIGIPQQYRLFKALKVESGGIIVLDARKLLQDPASVLSRLCNKMGLPFTDAMLRWPAGAREEDGVWAKYWYANVHKSSGFQPYKETTYMLSPKLEKIAQTCAPLYEEMLEAAL